MLNIIFCIVKSMGGSSNDNGKKRKSLTLEDRIKIVERISAGERQIDIADKLNISPSTVASINRRKKNILDVKEAVQSCGGDFQVKKCKGVDFLNKEAELYQWFIQQRDAGLPVSGFHLQEKALELNKKENDDNDSGFKASNGWLHRFKKRKGIRCLAIQGEKKSADTIASERFKLEFQNLMKLTNISLDCIYNCDETGLEWKQLPKRTLASRDEKSAAGRKQIKNRITVMNCTNASGSHKIPLYVIGTANQPHCFRGVKQLPVHYGNQKKAWMNGELMLKWYSDIFLPEVRKKHDFDNNPNIKIILIMDNAPSHPPAREFHAINEKCTVLFLPANVTSLIQPLDQGIIAAMKMHYRKLFLSHIYSKRAVGDVEAAFKSFTLLDAVKYCAKAWDNITSKSIRNCWKQLIPLDIPIDLEEESITLDNFHSFFVKVPEFSSFTMEETLQYLNGDNVSNETELENLSDSENSTSQDNMMEESNEDGANYELSSKISVQEGLDSLNKFIKYYEQDEDCCGSTLQLLERLSQSMMEKLFFLQYS